MNSILQRKLLTILTIFVTSIAFAQSAKSDEEIFKERQQELKAMNKSLLTISVEHIPNQKEKQIRNYEMKAQTVMVCTPSNPTNLAGIIRLESLGTIHKSIKIKPNVRAGLAFSKYELEQLSGAPVQIRDFVQMKTAILAQRCPLTHPTVEYAIHVTLTSNAGRSFSHLFLESQVGRTAFDKVILDEKYGDKLRVTSAIAQN
jgi:hypothetical protein